MKIGVSKVTGQRYPLYAGWLSHYRPDWAFIDVETYPEAMKDCTGLVLVGGPDVDPVHYGRPDSAPLCSINAERDAAEFSLFAQARERHLPVLGVCRGLQLAVVALGGTLIPDLPSEGRMGHHISHPGGVTTGRSAFGDPIHAITVDPDSQLYLRTGSTGIVNSSHHQAAGDPGPLLRVTATSADGVPEALEWKEPRTQPGLVLVQWHPERMDDFDHPLSAGPAEEFLEAVESVR